MFPEFKPDDVYLKSENNRDLENAVSTNDSHERQELSLEERQSLIDSHITAMHSLATSNLYTSHNGEGVEDVKVTTLKRIGKQQPVQIVKMDFPEGKSFDAVVRPTGQEYGEIYDQFESVRKNFPRIYYRAQDVTADHGRSKVFISERLNGYEQHDNGDKYLEHVANPENFEKLSEEIFSMVDEIYKDPLVLNDIGPVSGHNVFYNTDEDRFQFFDVDTIRRSDLPHGRKFLDFVDVGSGMAREEKRLEFAQKLLHKYMEKYPDFSFSYEDEERAVAEFMSEDEAVKGNVETINEGHPLYENAWKNLVSKAYYSKMPIPDKGVPIGFKRTKGKDVHSLSSELIEAVRSGNTQEFVRLAQEKANSNSSGKFTDMQFVPTN